MKSRSIRIAAVIALAVCVALSLFVVSYAEDVHTHVWSDELYVVVPASCDSTGLKAKKCECGEYDMDHTVVIPLAEHNYVKIAGKASSCSEEGYETFRCSGCGDEYTENLPYLEHNLGEYTLVRAATCKADGLEEAICADCGAHISKKIDKSTADHVTVTIDAVKPTCTKDGSSEGLFCRVCQKYIVKPEIIDATGHDFDFDNVKVDVIEPTCTDKGAGHVFCKNCGEALHVEVDKLPHVDDDGDGLCDVCQYDMKVQTCKTHCFCHYDTLSSIFARYFDTLLSKITGKDYRCCDDMEPLDNLVPEVFAYISRALTGTLNKVTEKVTLPSAG